MAVFINGVLQGGEGNVTFPAAQVTSSNANTFDDYEEGVWTPVLTFASAGDLSVVYTAQVGVYTKKGREVTISWEIITSTFTHTTASGTYEVTGLPFTAANVTNQQAYGAFSFEGITKATYTQFIPLVITNTATVSIDASGTASGRILLDEGDVPTAETKVHGGTITYII